MATTNNNINNNNKARTNSRHEVVNMLPTMDQRHLRAPPDEGQIQQATANASARRGMRRNRTKYSKAQLDILEATFERSHYPDAITVDKLATLLHLTIEKISIWFQNRRARYKRTRRNGARSPVAKAEGRLDINELVRRFNYQHEEDGGGGGDDDDEGSNTLYDDNSVMSQAATEASETSFDQAFKQQQQQRSSRSLGEIKNELLSADEDSRSSYSMMANYAAASYQHRMEPAENSNSNGYGGDASSSSSNHCYYNGHLAPYPGAVSHPDAYYHHSYYSNVSTVPSIDALVHQDAGSGSAAEPPAYPYAFYPSHFSAGFFGYPQHSSSAAAAAAAAAASYFSYQQHYQQTPAYEYANAYPPSSTLSGYNLATEEPSPAAMLPSPAPSSGSSRSANSDAASSEQPDSPGDADADDSHAASPAPEPEAPPTSEHYPAYY